MTVVNAARSEPSLLDVQLQNDDSDVEDFDDLPRNRKVRPKPGRRRATIQRVGLGVLGVALFLGIAEVISRSGIVDEQYLPSASRAILTASQIIVEPVFLSGIGWTMTAWLTSMVLACAIGIPAGIALAQSRIAFAASSSVIAAVRPIPAVALIPLVILVWGTGMGVEVGLTTWAIVWPILFNTMYGMRDMDPVMTETARSYGISGIRMLTRVIIPSAAPFVLTGIRVAASLAFVVAVGTELFAGTPDGIGAYILLQSVGGGDPATVVAGALWAGVIGLAVNIILGRIDSRVFRWAHRGVEVG